MELDPREGDVVLFRTKGSLCGEGSVVKRAGLRVRVEKHTEAEQPVEGVEGVEGAGPPSEESRMTWLQVKDVVKIIAVKRDCRQRYLSTTLSI